MKSTVKRVIVVSIIVVAIAVGVLLLFFLYNSFYLMSSDVSCEDKIDRMLFLEEAYPTGSKSAEGEKNMAKDIEGKCQIVSIEPIEKEKASDQYLLTFYFWPGGKQCVGVQESKVTLRSHYATGSSRPGKSLESNKKIMTPEECVNKHSITGGRVFDCTLTKRLQGNFSTYYRFSDIGKDCMTTSYVDGSQ